MYAVAIIRYRRPLEEVLEVTNGHRAYLRELQEEGLLPGWSGSAKRTSTRSARDPLARRCAD
jgi:uncharacterized protein YciI